MPHRTSRRADLPHFRPPPDDLREQMSWQTELAALAEAETCKVLVKHGIEPNFTNVQFESTIFLYRMSEPPTYQCIGGHVVKTSDAFEVECCGKCGEAIFDRCPCGLSALLTYPYKPPYQTVNPASHIARRESCPNCGRFYPWVQRYLDRATNEPLNAYEEQLLSRITGFPSEQDRAMKLNRLSREVGRFPITFLHRVLHSGVEIKDKRHPQHLQWVKVNSDHHDAVAAFRQRILAKRRQAFNQRVARAEEHKYWKQLTGRQFEEELANLLALNGIRVTHVGGKGDEGADLLIHRGGETIVVQCKAYSKPVGPGPVRDLLGALIHHKAQEAWLVSLEGFSDAAIRFASGKGIRLLPISSLLSKAGSAHLSVLINRRD